MTSQDDEDEDSDEDSDDDDTAALLAELEKIKKERAEELERKVRMFFKMFLVTTPALLVFFITTPALLVFFLTTPG